jgi:deazaflavin-dependent oxidoreductase (nitroreductase family)
MTTATVPTAPRELRSRVPSARVLHAINPFVAAILRSPLHRLLSGRVLLLTYTGRKTGARYTFPVGYSREGETLTIVSTRHWWKNLRGGAPVMVRLQGRRMARADVITEPDAVLAEVERLVARYGRAGASRRIFLALDTTPPPTRAELTQALRGWVVIHLRLEAGAAEGGRDGDKQ